MTPAPTSATRIGLVMTSSSSALLACQWGLLQRACGLPDACDQLVDRLLHRHLLVHDPVRRDGPRVFVVEHRKLVVADELVRHGRARDLVVHGLAMRVLLPERA